MSLRIPRLLSLAFAASLTLALPAASATVYPVQPAAGFDLGEGGLNSLLAKRYTEPFKQGAGGEEVEIDVHQAYFDFEEGSAGIVLDLQVRYDFLGSPKRATLKYSKALAVSQFSYTLSEDRVAVALGDLLNAYQGLPEYVRLHLAAHFGSFGAYAQDLIEYIGDGIPDAGFQPQPKYPVFLQGNATFAVSFHNDVVRFTVSPQPRDREHGGPGDAGPRNGDRFKNRFTISTNFQGTIYRIRIVTSLGRYENNNNGTHALVRSGTGRSSKAGSSTIPHWTRTSTPARRTSAQS